ncbi:MAG: amino acid permease [Desulfarculales bacterium]|nr:amino acid permease [Desulfarculales bacterium]
MPGASTRSAELSPSKAATGREPGAIYKAGMTREEWNKAVRFDGSDWGWVILSIGMAIGAGIVFLPVQVGLQGLWVFLLSSIIGYPGLYLFQRLFINTLSQSPRCADYPDIISGYLGKNWGALLGVLYFAMNCIWVFVYSTALNNDSASFLQSFGVTASPLSRNPLYGLALLCGLVAVASRGEKLLFKVSSFLVLTKLCIIVALGSIMVSRWNFANIGIIPPISELIPKAVVMLPFTLTSILFLQSLSPMVISYRARFSSVEVARHKALRTMNIAFAALFITVFSYAVSFTLAISHAQAVEAYQENISALAMVAQNMAGRSLRILSLILNLFAVITAFFSVYLGFSEAVRGLSVNALRRFMPEESINKKALTAGVILFSILVPWGAILLNAPVLSYTSICSPIFGLIGCLIPAYMVYKVPFLHVFRGPVLLFIIFIGLILVISPFLAFS